MARFTLRQLQYFRAAAELGSFSAAARQLFVSPTAVAAAISDLETALDAQLCVRRKAQGIDLTPAGGHVLDEARALLAAADELERTTRSHDGTLRGPVAIGCYATLAATVLPAMATGFAARHPEVALSHIDGSMDELVPLLQSGRLDALITYRINLPAGLEEVVLFETAVHVLLAGDHPLAGRETVALDELAHEPLIMFDLPPSGQHTLDMLHAAGVRPNVSHRTPNFELVRSMVARGLGYSLLVQKPVIDQSYEGLPLVAKRIHPQLSAETVLLVWPEGVRLNRRVTALIAFAQETIGPAQWTPSGV
jgi:DNA-binding transcriptional LysR family regulator